MSGTNPTCLWGKASEGRTDTDTPLKGCPCVRPDADEGKGLRQPLEHDWSQVSAGLAMTDQAVMGYSYLSGLGALPRIIFRPDGTQTIYHRGNRGERARITQTHLNDNGAMRDQIVTDRLAAMSVRPIVSLSGKSLSKPPLPFPPNCAPLKGRDRSPIMWPGNIAPD